MEYAVKKQDFSVLLVTFPHSLHEKSVIRVKSE